MVSFTCETRGSFAIVWSSEQYIGSGNAQLAFAAGASDVGEIRRSRSNSQTFATLTQSYNNSGVQVLISELHISVPPDSPNASVSCMHVGDGNISSIDFQVIGKLEFNLIILSNLTMYN